MEILAVQQRCKGVLRNRLLDARAFQRRRWGALVALASCFVDSAIGQDGSSADFVRRAEAADDWREWFNLGTELADKAPAEGFATLNVAWPRLSKAACRQQILKAWHFSAPAPYRMRMHPHVFEVLWLGLEDSDATTQDWARDFLESYAWQPLPTPQDARRWLGDRRGADVVDTWQASVTAWVRNVKGASEAEALRLVELLPKWGYPLRRNRNLQDIARTVDLERLLEKWVKNEELSGSAALHAFAWLMDLKPAEYTQEKYSTFSRELAERDKRREATIADDDPEGVRTVSGDPRKRWILHAPTNSARPPSAGFGLLVVLPGGDGAMSFAPFVRDTIHAAAGKDRYVVAQLISPPIAKGDQNAIVWPTGQLRDKRVGFTMELVILDVVKDVQSEFSVDPARTFIMGWSSGGTCSYLMAMSPESPFRGAFVAMSVFKPELLPAPAGAKGRRFFLLHSPQDFIPLRFAEEAKKKLSDAGAGVLLRTYEGGHGWHGNVYDNVSLGIRWLESGKSP